MRLFLLTGAVFWGCSCLVDAGSTEEMKCKSADPSTCHKEGNIMGKFFLAAKRGDVGTLRRLVEAGHVPNIDVVEDKTEETALFKASAYGQLSALEYLLISADFSKPNEWGEPPLLAAATNGHSACVAVLLRAGAEVDQIELDGETALMRSSQYNKKDPAGVMNALIEAGADVNYATDSGDTALMMAARSPSPPPVSAVAIELLVDNGARVNAQDRYGRTPFMRAAMKGKIHNMKLLRKLGADVSATDSRGRNALVLAKLQPKQSAAAIPFLEGL